MKRGWKLAMLTAAAVAMAVAASVQGASWYYTTQLGQGCAGCHEMARLTTAVHSSAHRTVGCIECHEASLETKLRHVRVHLFGQIPEQIVLREQDVVAMQASCQGCHRAEYAAWHAGPHAATYARIFTDAHHNQTRHLMDDCLRCHGMHFEGPIRDLVAPIDTRGPWRIVPAGLAEAPTVPCTSCHQMHREGKPMARQERRTADAPMSSTLALFDRRERLHLPAATLALPKLNDGARALRMSPDPRQALCYQCHAPRVPEAGSEAAQKGWGTQAGSGDDRTPMGVHEGLSCRACHTGHNESAAASCKDCHPKMSNCGEPVEKMDTSFANPESRHNIHWVRCVDCHTQGVPHARAAAASGSATM